MNSASFCRNNVLSCVSASCSSAGVSCALQDIHQRAVLLFADRLIQGQLPIPQALIHFDDIALPHIQSVGQELCIRDIPLALKLGLFFLEVVEEFSLVLVVPILTRR